MIQIAIPLAGRSMFYASNESHYPKPLIDVVGEPMIQRVVEALKAARFEKRFLFVVNEADAKKFHIDRVLRLIVGNEGVVIEQPGESKGALPSCLLLIDHLEAETPLLISNSDQVVDIDFDEMLEFFQANNVDAGCVTFKSVHPQWSYVAFDERGYIAEAAEKKPISNHAVAGLYYFAKARYFVSAAMQAIEKGSVTADRFYISSTFNELILDGRKLLAREIEASKFHSFYSPEMLSKYIDRMGPKWAMSA
jgi:NDP-sugar pyrophosphorylase family protein